MTKDKNKQEREAFEAEHIAMAVLEHCYGATGFDDTMLAQTAAVARATLSQPQAGSTLSDGEIIELWTGDPTHSRPVMGRTKVLAFARAILARSTADASNAVTGQGMTRQQILDAVEPFSDDYMHQHYSDDIVQMVRERLLAASAAPAPTMHCETREEVDRALDWIAPSAPAEPAPTDEEIEDFLAARMTNEGRVPMIATIREALAKWGNAAPAPAAQLPSDFIGNVRFVYETFRRDIEQGYVTKDKQFAVSLLGKALECMATQADGPTIDLMHESYQQIINAYVSAFAPPPEVMGNDIIGHVCKMIADAATPADAASEADKSRRDLHSHMMNVAMTAWREEADRVADSSVRSRLRAVCKAIVAEPKIRAAMSNQAQKGVERG